MAKEANESHLAGEFIDRKTWRRISDAMQGLVAKNATQYLLSESFLSQDDHFIGKHYPDQVLGMYGQQGDLAAGALRFIWFNSSADNLLAEGRQENLRGMLEFAKQSDGTYFHGTMRMYEYASGEAEVVLDANGYSAGNDPERGFEFNAFAHEVGLTKLWSQIYENSGNNIEQQFNGRIDPQTSWSVAYALSQLEKSAT